MRMSGPAIVWGRKLRETMSLQDDGRDLTQELAEAIALLSDGNPAMIVLSASFIAKLSRQDQLKFLTGDMTVLNVANKLYGK